jgi:hypothetical protein
MSVYLFSDKDISIVASFAQQIKLGDANAIGQQLAEQNVAAFNSRHANLTKEVNFTFIPNLTISQNRSLTELVRDLMVNSFTDKVDSTTNILTSRILRNSIAIEFGEQIFHDVIGKQCRVSHCYSLLNFVVAELPKGYKIASYDEDRKVFRIFNAQKSAVTLLGCNHLSTQQVGSLVYSIEKLILEGKSVFIENSSLTAYKNHPNDFYTIELKEFAPEQMVESLLRMNAINIADNIWKVSNNIITVLRDLCPKGSVYI